MASRRSTGNCGPAHPNQIQPRQAQYPITFFGRQAVHNIMHHKQAALGPVLIDTLGLSFPWSANIDTDQLGTFAAEVAR